MLTSVTFWPGRNDGDGDRGDGDPCPVDLTKLSELPVTDSNDCGAYEELIVSARGFGGGGVGDLRGIGDA